MTSEPVAGLSRRGRETQASKLEKMEKREGEMKRQESLMKKLLKENEKLKAGPKTGLPVAKKAGGTASPKVRRRRGREVHRAGPEFGPTSGL